MHSNTPPRIQFKCTGRSNNLFIPMRDREDFFTLEGMWEVRVPKKLILAFILINIHALTSPSPCHISTTMNILIIFALLIIRFVTAADELGVPVASPVGPGKLDGASDRALG